MEEPCPDEDDFTCVKQIGRGSFANVFLFEHRSFVKSSLQFDSLVDSLIFSSSVKRSPSQFFIIKEIDLSRLTNRYVSKQNRNVRYDNNSPKVNFTPYTTNNTISIRYTEQEHYRTRLAELIEGEIYILKMISHPNIIRFLSSSLYNDIYSIKMEYCNLGDLYNVLKERLDERDAYPLKKFRNSFNGFNQKFVNQFLIDTINGLNYIHSLSIIHRDIKLQNILLHMDPQQHFTFKITDFGFACYDLKEPGSSERVNSVETNLKNKFYKLCGTPYYMAPEMILNLDQFEQMIASSECQKSNDKLYEYDYDLDNKIYDSRVDLWSYGICLYELIFNVLPFSDLNHLNDLKKFYGHPKTQILIDQNISEKTIISEPLKILLKRLLTIKPNLRIDGNTLKSSIEELEIDHDIENIKRQEKGEYRETPRENIKRQEKGEKGELPRGTVQENTDINFEINLDSWSLDDSWDNTLKFSGSIDLNFKKWLGY